MAAPLPLIQPDTVILLVVDLQDRLLDAIHEAEACVQASGRMIDIAREIGLPIIVTEQYPEGIGHTCQKIRQRLTDIPVITKTRFSVCVDEVVEQLAQHDRPHVVVVGIEAHVCVLQTVLDLLRLGYTPYVCADAVGSRRPLERQVALERMAHAGAIISTVESVTLEMLGQAATDVFRRILPIIK